jgi:D-lactate dehydratase
LIVYPDATGLHSIAANAYDAGDIISIICHGGAIFPGLIGPKAGKSIIAGKKVTEFTAKGENVECVLETIKSWHRPTIEAAAASAGATCESTHYLRSLVLIWPLHVSAGMRLNSLSPY